MENANGKGIFDFNAFGGMLEGEVPATSQEFRDEITSTVQEILDERFPDNPNKRRIKRHKDSISFACPLCGDSAHDDTKKRGNIMLAGKYANKFKCHNCGTFMSVPAFVAKFGKDISLKGIDYITSSDVPYERGDRAEMDALFDADLIDHYALDRDAFKARCGLEETDVPNMGHFYLIGRKQYDFRKFLYNPRGETLFVLNLTQSGKILGLQIRHLSKSYRGPKYVTYNLSRIYSTILQAPADIPDGIDSLSMLFDIMTIDYRSPVIVTEGPMDSFLLRNSMAMCGASKSLPVSLKFNFLFDDDETGRKHALDKLSEGYDVFMWERLKADLNLPQRRKWDVNDVVIWCCDNRKPLPTFEKYFSSDSLDMLDI